MKKFIFTVPLQERLDKVKYESDNPKYQYDKTRFPIIPVINGAVKNDNNAKIEIIAIIPTNEDGSDHTWVENNFECFKNEMLGLKESKIIQSYKITEIKTLNDGPLSVQLKLLKELMDNINDNEQLYVCMTYGTKIAPIVLFNALNYGEKIKENVSVESVVYGWRNFQNTDDNKLCDETALYFANSMIYCLAELGDAVKPEEVLKQFLEF